MLTVDGQSVPSSINAVSDELTLGVIGLATLALTIIFFLLRNITYTKKAADQATQANNAVNNVGPGEHRLYDRIADLSKDVEHLMLAQEDFLKHGWGALPADIGNASALTETIRSLQYDSRSVHEKVDTILLELREHVAWEMNAKYGAKGSEK